MGADRRQWQKLTYKVPKTYFSDHLMVIGTLIARIGFEHKKYTKEREQFPFLPPDKVTHLDRMMENIIRLQPKPKHQEVKKIEWISNKTWTLVDRRVELWRHFWMHQDIERPLLNLNTEIRRSLRKDRHNRAVTAGDLIEQWLLADGLIGAWEILKRWYHNVTGKLPKPSLFFSLSLFCRINPVGKTFGTIGGRRGGW